MTAPCLECGDSPRALRHDGQNLLQKHQLAQQSNCSLLTDSALEQRELDQRLSLPKGGVRIGFELMAGQLVENECGDAHEVGI